MMLHNPTVARAASRQKGVGRLNGASLGRGTHVARWLVGARHVRVAAAALLCCLGLLGIFGTPAQASLVHKFEGQFQRPGAFVTVSVDNSTDKSSGNLYVGEASVKFVSGKYEFPSRVLQMTPAGGATGVELNGAETPAGSFSFGNGTTFALAGGPTVAGGGNNAGDVYVPDVLHGVVDVFNEKGEYECQITGSTTPSASECAGATGSNTPQKAMEPISVAVDPGSGMVAVGDASGAIYEFNEAGEYLREIASAKVTSPFSLAFNDAGELYVVNAKPSRGVYGSAIELNANGELTQELGSGYTSVAVDLNNDHVYLGKSGAGGVEELNATGNRVTTFAEKTEATSLASSKATSKVYVGTKTSGIIQIWSGDEFIPDVTIAEATEVAETTAVLHGEVDPEVAEGGSDVTKCQFEYIDASGYEKAISEGAANPYASGEVAACAPSTATPYSSATVVTASPHLVPSTTYHYRLVAENQGGAEGRSADATLTTYGAPSISAERAQAFVARGAAYAQIDPYGLQATCELQYVTQAKFAESGYTEPNAVPCVPEGLEAGFETDGVEASLPQLAPDTIYHYRFVARNSGGTTNGADQEVATFGVQSFAFEALGQRGEAITQAGAHPYEWVDTFALNTSVSEQGQATDANPKDIITQLPPGMIGNPDATPKCKPYDVTHEDCSGATQVGTVTVLTANPGTVLRGYLSESSEPLYNLAPPDGLAAQFGARFTKEASVYINARVRTGAGYGVTAEVIDGSTAEGIVSATVTLWGAPAAESHNKDRYCPDFAAGGEVRECSEHGPLLPFLTNPTACMGDRQAHMTVEPWQETELWWEANVPPTSAPMPAVTGCGKVHFAPSMAVTPTAKTSDSPTGLRVELTIPQNEDPNGLAEADLKDAKVVLPAGVTVNPSSANGMVGCPLLTGKQAHPGQPGIDLENGEAANCPDASKVGSVRIQTPLLEEELTGAVYVAQQDANPFKSLLALYIAAEAPERGVVIKLAGHVELNPSTGQLTTTFDENPQLPFETLKLDFFGGQRASLATPRACGSYQATSLLEPWSHQPAEGEAEGTPDAEPFIQPFTVSSGPNGIACGSSPFAPIFEAGTANNQAGGYGSFVMNLKRRDGERRLSTVSMTLPKGLAGMLGKVPLCGEAQANAGRCPAASKIGHVVVQAGVGSEPITLPEADRGQDPVYLTGSYEGAPFGLSIVVPAQAGPFDLGTIVVRAKIYVNPRTAQVGVVSNPMPQMLQGIPVDLKALQVTVDRSRFMFNPTSCEVMQTTGSIGSAEGATAAVSSRFQAAGCRGLAFKPKFTASTSAKTSRKDGASLHVKITYPKGAQGSEANLKYVKVQLPRALPSNLEALKHACTESQFAKNPAGCPPESVVGHAVVHTPVLPVPLKGPAYFLSHGGAEFPELVMVLQGYGVTIQLNGKTFIHKGITTSTFSSTPDVPFSSFQLTLPQRRKFAALAGNGNFCHRTIVKKKRVKLRRKGHVVHRKGKVVFKTRKVRHKVKRKLVMPTRMIGQNGAVIEQNTKIHVTGCGGKHKGAKAKRKGAKAKEAGRRQRAEARKALHRGAAG